MLNFNLLPSVSIFPKKSPIFNDFHIYNIGFHNFTHIKGLHNVRMQALYTVHFILDGEGCLQVNDTWYNLKKGDVFYLPPNIPYIYYPSQKNPWIYAWVAIEGDKATEYFSNSYFKNNVYVYHLKKADIVLHFIHDFFLTTTSKTLQEEKMFSVFFSLMGMIVDDQPNTENEQPLVEKYLKQIKDTIYCNYLNPHFKIEDLSAIVNLSYPYIIKIFKKAFNVPLKKYLYNLRLEQASNLLLNTTRSISDIAYNSGFSDPLYFSSSFKKHYGLSPKEYRKQHKNEI